MYTPGSTYKIKVGKLKDSTNYVALICILHLVVNWKAFKEESCLFFMSSLLKTNY